MSGLSGICDFWVLGWDVPLILTVLQRDYSAPPPPPIFRAVGIRGNIPSFGYAGFAGFFFQNRV